MCVVQEHLFSLAIIDESTGNLGSSNGNEVMNLLTELIEAVTTIQVTQSEYDTETESYACSIFKKT